jgi:hypothetical protein
MVLSTALFDKPAFKNLVCNGLVLAADGKKMSKRLKNYPVRGRPITLHGVQHCRMRGRCQEMLCVCKASARVYMCLCAVVRGHSKRCCRFSNACLASRNAGRSRVTPAVTLLRRDLGQSAQTQYSQQ